MSNDLMQAAGHLNTAAGLIPNENLKRLIFHVRERILTPMVDILEAVPGETKRDKAKAIGISRTAYWQWEVEESRPSEAHARKISKLTGIKVSDITATKYEEQTDDVGGTVRRADTRVAEDGEKLPAGPRRVRAGNRGVASKPSERRGVRKVRRRASQDHVSA